MITFCVVAFAILGKADPVMFALPNCDPKTQQSIVCSVNEPSRNLPAWATCTDDKKRLVYSGPAHRIQET